MESKPHVYRKFGLAETRAKIEHNRTRCKKGQRCMDFANCFICRRCKDQKKYREKVKSLNPGKRSLGLYFGTRPSKPPEKPPEKVTPLLMKVPRRFI